MCLPPRPPLPSISSFPSNYDPMHQNWQSSFAQPSQPSAPAPVVISNDISMDDLYKYMLPVNPNNTDQIVIGVYTRGKSTKPKEHLPGVYEDAHVPLCCHSCGNMIRKIAEDLLSMIGDHQPPTVLFEYLTNYRKMVHGIFGKYGRAAFEIEHLQLPLYIFSYNNIKYQTNNYNIAVNLSHQKPITVQYGTCSEQYLYPQCETCSAKQGRLLL